MIETSTKPKAITSAQMLQLITEGIQDRKGRNITLVDLSEIESAGVSHFVICQGTSNMQVSAIADSIRDYLLEHAGIKPFNYDGYENSQWIVIDYGDTLVHVFLPQERERYNLEDLWSDAKITQIPDLD
ncbi:MAG: ribosome silencing factor [Bacteroides sp.]|nr:ribosome silencing factor [Bacteroides sp.]MCM1477254.1 ribosome silencing factor [Bacteroides sp.]